MDLIWDFTRATCEALQGDYPLPYTFRAMVTTMHLISMNNAYYLCRGYYLTLNIRSKDPVLGTRFSQKP